LARHGRVLIVDLHSYATEPLPYERHPDQPRPPVCLGYEDLHAPDVDFLADRFRRAGFEPGRNTPFSGSYVPLAQYGRDGRVQSVMVELRKDQLLSGPELEPDGHGRVIAARFPMLDADRVAAVARIVTEYIAAWCVAAVPRDRVR
ncbi:MAG: N-formylglutamate amidohydrolase, partial [Bifidobacteriaceae bacterium]|nr:N-formylglutamate amidohydrolase [Bifidobacteriaceae bacterium]